MNKRKALDLFLAAVIFACAGITTVYVSDLVLGILKIERWTAAYFVLIPVIIMPSHNILLLFYSFLFGRFNYFWEKEKMLLKKLINLFK